MQGEMYEIVRVFDRDLDMLALSDPKLKSIDTISMLKRMGEVMFGVK